MIRFQPITLADRARIESYTMGRGLYNCDLSFANIFCWRAFYDTAWAEVEGFLVIRFRIDGGAKTGYMQPIGEGDFGAVIRLLIAEAEAQGEPLRLVGLTEEGKSMLEEAFPDHFAFDDNRATRDYLYRREDLSRLQGKNYQPKRNHINRFTSNYPTYRYETLTRDHFAQCIELEQEWCRHRNGCTEGGLNEERQAMVEAFDHFEELGLQGGCIYVEDRLIAFTYGSALNDHTFDIHVEKADTRYEGAFTIINRLFAEQLDPRFTLLNREEDLGLEGLRKAKLSYYPTRLQVKYRAELLDAGQQACRRLWLEAFPDEGTTYVEQFLIRHYRAEQMLTYEADGKVVAMLHLIPLRTTLGEFSYLYAVATATAYRNRGYASELIHRAIAEGRIAGKRGLFLIPASSSLRNYYAREGFSGAVPTRFFTGDDFDFGTGVVERDLAMLLPFEELEQMPDALLCHLSY
ncbi:MAG: GNAT family N-acetyltransferase [Alistipes sp.]|nr:GNAT family N-acetyltransferase [Alistipes sp.]